MAKLLCSLQIVLISTIIKCNEAEASVMEMLLSSPDL